MKNLVIKIGGHLCFDENGPNIDYIKKLIKTIKKLDRKYKTTVVIGGGIFVRKYIKNFTKLKLKNEQTEWIVIQLLRANVLLFSYLLNKKPVFSINEITSNCVIGGIKPGRCTDTNAAIAAKKTKSILIKITDVDGIYDKDPKKYKNAKLFRKISFNELKTKRKTAPGRYGILDPTAIKIIKQNKIKTYVINGKDPENIIKLLNGAKIGTEIG